MLRLAHLSPAMTLLGTALATVSVGVCGGIFEGLLFRQAHAAEVTDVASSFDAGHPFGAHLSVGYQRTLFRGAIKRERTGRPDQTKVELAKELRFSQVRHVISQRAEIGIWRDLQLHVEVPIIISDDRNLDFTQNGGDPCGTDFCVTRDNSTLVAEGFFRGSQMAPDQIAVANSDGPAGGLLLPTRSGIDQFYLGLTWAALNQRRDSTKPTWTIGFESRISVGSPMEYDGSIDPNANTSVGRGLHELHFWSSVSRRFGRVDPWVNVFYMLPIARSSSLFEKTRISTSGQRRSGPQHVAGAEIGTEIIPWEQPEHDIKIVIELKTGLTAFFEGRGYSPMWEVFANSTQLVGNCQPEGGPLGPTDTSPWDNGTYCASPTDTMPYPGITHIENYLNLTGSLALSAYLTRYFRAQIGASLGHDQSHFITFGNTGQAADPNQPIDRSDPFQLDPLFRDTIDAVGRRLRVEETTIFDFFVSIAGMF